MPLSASSAFLYEHDGKLWVRTVSVDGKRRKERKDLFPGCEAGLVFLTTFKKRRTKHSFLPHIARDPEVWFTYDLDHMVHLNGEQFFWPYPNVMFTK